MKKYCFETSVDTILIVSCCEYFWKGFELLKISHVAKKHAIFVSA